MNLGKIRILKFIGKNEAGAGASLRQNTLVAVQQGVRPGDHVAEGAKIFFRQPALHGRENVRNFATASQNLSIIDHIL